MTYTHYTDEQLRESIEFARGKPGLRDAISEFEAVLTQRKRQRNRISIEEKAGYIRHTWNDKIGNRGREAACLIVSPDGRLFRFTGRSIDGVVKVINADYQKKGKWSSTTYTFLTKKGVSIIRWQQDWENGQFWPQTSWGEAMAWVESQSNRQTSMDHLKQLISDNWPSAANRFDKNEIDSLGAFFS